MATAGPLGRAPWLRLAGRLSRSAVDGVLFAANEHATQWRRAGLIGAASTGLPGDGSQHASAGRAAGRAARNETGLSGSPAVLWVGRLNANKDPLAVLDGFERALRDLAGATLTMIYGEDDLLGAVRQRVDRSPALRDAGPPRGRGAARPDGVLLQRRRSLCGRQPPRGERLRADGGVRLRRGAGGHRHPDVQAVDRRWIDRRVVDVAVTLRTARARWCRQAPRSGRGTRTHRGPLCPRIELGRGRPPGDGHLPPGHRATNDERRKTKVEFLQPLPARFPRIDAPFLTMASPSIWRRLGRPCLRAFSSSTTTRTWSG